MYVCISATNARFLAEPTQIKQNILQADKEKSSDKTTLKHASNLINTKLKTAIILCMFTDVKMHYVFLNNVKEQYLRRT